MALGDVYLRIGNDVTIYDDGNPDFIVMATPHGKFLFCKREDIYNRINQIKRDLAEVGLFKPVK